MTHSFTYPVNSGKMLRGELEVKYMNHSGGVQITSVKWDGVELLALFESDQMGHPYYQLVLAAENNYANIQEPINT